VREKRGLAYSVHAIAEKYPDTGYLAVQAGVEHGKLQKAVATILAEFRRIKNVKVSDAELKKAKAHIKGTLTLALETSDAVAAHAATSLISLGKVRTLEETIKNIEEVRTRDVMRVAKDLLRMDKLNLAVIGPHVHGESLKSLLRILKL
jgi:predicted Zn-dependent peptidase